MAGLCHVLFPFTLLDTLKERQPLARCARHGLSCGTLPHITVLLGEFSGDGLQAVVFLHPCRGFLENTWLSFFQCIQPHIKVFDYLWPYGAEYGDHTPRPTAPVSLICRRPQDRVEWNGFCYSPPFQWAGEGATARAVRQRCGSPRQRSYRWHLLFVTLKQPTRRQSKPFYPHQLDINSAIYLCLLGGGIGYRTRVLPSLVKLSTRHIVKLTYYCWVVNRFRYCS